MPKVKNLNDTSDRIPSTGNSWRQFWEDESGKKIDKCRRRGCTEKATDGAHVIKADSDDRRWYIVPLCHKCNMKPSSEEFYVDKEDLVPVRD